MYNIEFFKEQLQKRQTKKRYIHSLNVADSAAELAGIYDADMEKAYTAGLLHDICKDIPFTEQKTLLDKSNFVLTQEEFGSKQLWHAVAGACYIYNTLDISDEDIINSVRFHTIGRADMSRLEEIIYLADLISIDRKYKDVSRIRKLARTDLNRAMLEGLQYSILSVAGKFDYLPRYTIEAYNQYKSKCEEK